MKKDSIFQIIAVTLAVCFVCSIAVSMSAVLLREKQNINRELARKRNILTAANVINPQQITSAEIEEIFSNVELRLADLNKGVFVDEPDVASYDQRKAEKDPALSIELSSNNDIASIGSRENYSLVYFISGDNKQVAVFPIRGYGLWSTLRGYLALDTKDYNTIAGLTFYEHAETPGLGGEVDNEGWKEQWRGKMLSDNEGNPAIRLVRGAADGSGGATAGNWKESDESDEDWVDPAAYQVEALSGASITSNGVNNLLQFWFGDLGFKKLIENIKGNKV